MVRSCEENDEAFYAAETNKQLAAVACTVRIFTWIALGRAARSCRPIMPRFLSG
jgi:hypothetical protein